MGDLNQQIPASQKLANLESGAKLTNHQAIYEYLQAHQRIAHDLEKISIANGTALRATAGGLIRRLHPDIQFMVFRNKRDASYDDTVKYLLNWLIDEKVFTNSLDPVSAKIRTGQESDDQQFTPAARKPEGQKDSVKKGDGIEDIIQGMSSIQIAAIQAALNNRFPPT